MANCKSNKDCTSCLQTNENCYWSTINQGCSTFMNSLSDLTNGDSCPAPPKYPNISPLTFNDNSSLVASDLNDSQLKILTDISFLQDLEKDLYTELETGVGTNSLTSDQQTILMTRISEISAIRINLYKQLNNTYDFFKSNLSSSQNTIREQLLAINIVEEELKNSALKLESLNNENTEKVRMIEINRYYGEKYNYQTGFIKYFILFTILIFIVILLKNKYVITQGVYSVLLFIIIFITCIVMGNYYYKMVFRNNMDYQEFTYPLANLIGNTSQIQPVISGSINDPWINNEINAINNCMTNIENAPTTATTSSSSNTNSSSESFSVTL
jgi:hypothetical protein